MSIGHLLRPSAWAFLLLYIISGRVDKAYATETVDSDSIPGRVKPKIIEIGIHRFPA